MLDNQKVKNAYSEYSDHCNNCTVDRCTDIMICEFKYTCKLFEVEFNLDLVKEYLEICDKHMTMTECDNCSLGLYCIQNFIDLKSLKKL